MNLNSSPTRVNRVHIVSAMGTSRSFFRHCALIRRGRKASSIAMYTRCFLCCLHCKSLELENRLKAETFRHRRSVTCSFLWKEKKFFAMLPMPVARCRMTSHRYLTSRSRRSWYFSQALIYQWEDSHGGEVSSKLTSEYLFSCIADR